MHLNMDIKGYYNTKPAIDIDDIRSTQVKRGTTFDEESRRDKIAHSFEEFRAQSQHSMLSDYMPELTRPQDTYTREELMNMPIDVVPYNDLKFFKKLIRILTPFEMMNKKVWVTDAFIYPQVFITCVVICFFSMAYLAYQTLTFILNFTNLVNDAYDQVYSSAFSFLRNGLERYFYIFKYECTTSDLDPYYNKLKDVGVTVDQLVLAIKIGALVGMIIATTAVVLNLFWLMFDYKTRMLDARKGIFNFPKDKITIQSSAGLPGGIISNSIFVFFF